MSTPSFLFGNLPLHLQESILSLLPISSLLRCSAASTYLCGLISSLPSSTATPPSPIFLFSDGLPCAADAYDPFLRRWLSFPIPSNTLFLSSSSGPLLLSSSPRSSLLVSDLFHPSRAPTPIPLPFDPNSFYPLALISETPCGAQFKIVMVSTSGGRIRSWVFGSSLRQWAQTEEFQGAYTMIGNAAFLDDDGLLYCLARGPDCLLTFNPVSNEWKLLDVVGFPAGHCLHVLVFDGRLFLVGGVEEMGVMVRVGIWELDRVGMQWKAFCFMPDDVFAEFSRGVHYFQTVDRKGYVCFVGKKRSAKHSILMCNLAVKSWWWTECRERRSVKMQYRLVHAVEPYIDLVKARRLQFGSRQRLGKSPF